MAADRFGWGFQLQYSPDLRGAKVPLLPTRLLRLGRVVRGSSFGNVDVDCYADEQQGHGYRNALSLLSALDLLGHPRMRTLR